LFATLPAARSSITRAGSVSINGRIFISLSVSAATAAAALVGFRKRKILLFGQWRRWSQFNFANQTASPSIRCARSLARWPPAPTIMAPICSSSCSCPCCCCFSFSFSSPLGAAHIRPTGEARDEVGSGQVCTQLEGAAEFASCEPNLNHFCAPPAMVGPRGLKRARFVYTPAARQLWLSALFDLGRPSRRYRITRAKGQTQTGATSAPAGATRAFARPLGLQCQHSKAIHLGERRGGGSKLWPPLAGCRARPPGGSGAAIIQLWRRKLKLPECARHLFCSQSVLRPSWPPPPPPPQPWPDESSGGSSENQRSIANMRLEFLISRCPWPRTCCRGGRCGAPPSRPRRPPSALRIAASRHAHPSWARQPTGRPNVPKLAPLIQFKAAHFRAPACLAAAASIRN